MSYCHGRQTARAPGAMGDRQPGRPSSTQESRPPAAAPGTLISAATQPPRTRGYTRGLDNKRRSPDPPAVRSAVVPIVRTGYSAHWASAHTRTHPPGGHPTLSPSGPRTVDQLIARYRLEIVARPKIARHHPLDLGAVAFADAAERAEQPNNQIVAGQPIGDALTSASTLTSAARRRSCKECRLTR